jgi:metallophosphoesterase (TIGR00282 family)
VRALFIGDIVGPPGLAFIRKVLPGLRSSERIDLVVANAENATNGSGLLPRDYRHLRAAGVDAVTLGDHIYRRLDIADVLNDPAEPVCKPANYPTAAPGRDHVLLQTPGFGPVAVVSLMGRTYMKPVDCPFAAIDRVLVGLAGKAKLILVDVHAEATADKYLLARYLEGRVTAVVGTHTHVPTADEQVLPGGTAFICDVGMTGPYDGILGRKADRVLHTVTTFEPNPFDVATGDVRLAGAVVDADPATGRAIAIRRILVRESD